jgi:sarcosine oxidase subunit beta
MDFYADVQERLQMRVDPGFRACGYLFLAHSEDVRGKLTENVRLQNSLGVSSRTVTPAEIAELVPGLDVTTVAGGAWSADDGYFDRPQSIVEAFGALADVQLGDVRAVGDDGVVTLQSGDQLEPGAVVIAAGVDTPHLLPELPIRPEAHYLFFSDPITERLLEPLVISAELRFAAKQLADGRLLASDLGAHGQPETNSEDWRATVKEAREALLPRLVYVALPQLVEGLYDVTPDHQAILGRVRDRVWVAAGFSGHGFMHAPAVGRILAEAVLEGREDESLGILDPGRFAEGRLVPEPQVV